MNPQLAEIERLRKVVRCLSEVIIYCENNEPKEVFSSCEQNWQDIVKDCENEDEFYEEENFISYINKYGVNCSYKIMSILNR
jgi:hypothetical protein